MARTVLEFPGEDVGVFGGQFDIYGTTSGGEEITILTGTDVWLDPSFNTGGDTIHLPGEAEDYTARLVGSYVILESTINDVTVEIPVGPAGITIVFGGDDSRTLYYDTVDMRVEMDGEVIDASADPLSPGADGPPPGQIFNLNEGSETIIGTEGDDRFRASNNELGSGDLIMGMGGNDRLEVSVDSDAIDAFDVFEFADGDIDYAGFETESVEQVLVTNDMPFYPVVVDMSGANGVELVGSVNSSNTVQFNHVNSLADVLIDNLTIAAGNDVEVFYRSGVTAGADDTVNVTIIDSSLDMLTLGTVDNMGVQVNTGIETVNLMIDGNSTMNNLDTELTNLNIDGAGDLVINNPLEDTVRDIDATGLDGDIDIDFSNNTAGVVYDGAIGDNTVNAGDGDDTINTQDGEDTVYGNAGDDVINTNGGADTVFGNDGNDTIDVGTGNNLVDAGAGDDFVTATEADGVTLAGGTNNVTGGTGDDTVILGDGGSLVDLGSGNDSLVTGDGSDYVLAGSGAEDISTGGGADYAYFYGELGIEDEVNLGAGEDYLYVNAGTVDVDYTNVSNTENLVLVTSGATVLAGQAQQAGIVTVYGTPGDDVINASAYTTGITIYPGMGNDTLTTGTGDDMFVFSGDGAFNSGDTINAGTGLDTLSLDGDTAVFVDNYDGIDLIVLNSGGVGGNQYSLYLTPGNGDENGVLVVDGSSLQTGENVYLDGEAGWGNLDVAADITTGGGNDTIYTGSGAHDDVVRSGAGNDYVSTFAGDDDIHLGAGDDVAIAGSGADRLYGDTGADSMNLGADADVDTVLYANVSDSSFAGSDTRDTISNFDSGEDVIDISELLASNGISSANTEYIFGQDLDQAEAQMVAGDGIISYVYIETLPGEPTEIGADGDGYFFVDINDDGELGGEDLQVFILGDQVLAGDVDTTLNISGESGYDIFLDDIGMAPMMMMMAAPDVNFA